MAPASKRVTAALESERDKEKIKRDTELGSDERDDEKVKRETARSGRKREIKKEKEQVSARVEAVSVSGRVALRQS